MELIKFLCTSWWVMLLSIVALTVIGSITLNIFNSVLNFIFKVYNRQLRFWNIRKHGYPAGCDADGDFKAQQ